MQTKFVPRLPPPHFSLTTHQMHMKHPTVVALPLPVIIHDGVESVCDGEDGTVAELLPYCLLEEVICLKVNGSRRFVQD